MQVSLKFSRILDARHMPEAINRGQWVVVLHYIHIPFHTITHRCARAREAPAHGTITRSNIQHVTTKINNSV
jgi:hypothetical protein